MNLHLFFSLRSIEHIIHIHLKSPIVHINWSPTLHQLQVEAVVTVVAVVVVFVVDNTFALPVAL